MRVLVTGGRGLLGSAVVAELLLRGHEVTTLQRRPSRTPVREVLGDIRDRESVAAAMAGQEAVVHLAAHVSVVGPWEDFRSTNVDGTRTVVDAARSAGVARFVHVSSPSVAHSGHALICASAGPADPGRARGHYARSKAEAELCALAADGPDLAVTAIRPHLVWGPGDTQLIEPIVERARSGRLVLINGGEALIDTTYVANAATALAHALERCDMPQVRGRALVVSNGEPRTVAEILGRISASAGVAPPVRSVPFPLAWGAGAVAEGLWPLVLRASRGGRSGAATHDPSDVPPLTRFLVEQLATAHWFDQRTTREALAWAPAVTLDEGFAQLRASFAG